MFVKMFAQIYDSSLVEDWKALITFQQFLVLADSQGVVDMTPEAISRRTNIPLEIINHGIAELEKPDRRSRSPGSEGRRIERLDDHRDWGWQLVNYQLYRNLASAEEKREADRQRIAKKRAAENGKTSVKSDTSQPVADSRIGSHPSQPVADVAHAEAEAEAEAVNQDTGQQTGLGDGDVPRDETQGPFKRFWLAYPKKVKKRAARKLFANKNCAKHIEMLLQDIATRKAEDDRWLRGFAPDPTTYLNGERWNDEISHARCAA